MHLADFLLTTGPHKAYSTSAMRAVPLPFRALAHGLVLWFLAACQAEPAPPLPTVRTIQPNRVPAGTVVTIAGEHFSANPADNRVAFNGVTAPVTAATTTALTTTVPTGVFDALNGPVEATVTVTTEGRQSPTTVQLLSDLAPEFTSVAPAAARVGEVVVIRGRNFNPEAARNFVLFASKASTGPAVPATLGAVTPTSIQFTVPAAAPSGEVRVWTSPTTDRTTQYGSQFDFTVLP